MTHGHGRNVCEFGIVHSQCRCPDSTINTINRITCPTPDACVKLAAIRPRQPKRRKDPESLGRVPWPLR